MNTLKLIFKLNNGKTTALSLADPKEGLTGTEVAEVAGDIIEQKVIRVGDAYPETIKRIYIQNSKATDLL